MLSKLRNINPFCFFSNYFKAISIIILLLVCGKNDQLKTTPDSSQLKPMSTSNVLEPLPLPIKNHPSIYEIKPIYAIQSCTINLEGNFLVDGYNSFCNLWSKDFSKPHTVKDSCPPPIDTESEFMKAKEQNDNNKIPTNFLKKGKLKISGKDNLTLQSGVYYFKEYF